MLSFRYPDNQEASKQTASPKAISLVNLALIEPPAPEKPAPPPEKPQPPLPMPEPPAAEPAEPVETFISLEAPPESALPEPDGGSAEAPASSQPPPPAEPGGAVLTRAYLQRNYEYIQRHIRDKLIYPPEARRSGIQGVAELSFVIHIDGQVSNVRITVSSGSETLDASAVEAIYSAAPFRPPPHQARLVIPVAFRLR
jgi:protein TonB